MKRRRHVADDSEMNLDSFLDIVTNVIGALFIVLVYIAISSSGATGKVMLPKVQPTATEPRFFECRGNTLIDPDIDGLNQALESGVERLVNQKGQGNVDVSDVTALRIRNDFYTLDAMPLLFGTTSFDVRADSPPGENGVRLGMADSAFIAQLAKLDPTEKHIYFFVRDDSFEVFHAARKVAMQQGFRVGWGPMPAEQPLRFGSGGMAAGAQ